MTKPANTAIDRPYWDEKLETQSRADWDALKLDLLQKHLKHAYANSPYYKASFDAAGVHPDDVKSLADIRRFPFIEKKVLRERQEALPPFGDLVAVLDAAGLSFAAPLRTALGERGNRAEIKVLDTPAS